MVPHGCLGITQLAKAGTECPMCFQTHHEITQYGYTLRTGLLAKKDPV